MNYARYAELVSAIINGSATVPQRVLVANFETAQPEKCPHCGERLRSQFQPVRIIHDIENCPRQVKA